jgi:hypothetical protein
MYRRTTWVRGVARLAAVAWLSGCSLSGLNFREDTRVDVIAPADRSQVALPLTVEWTVRDFDGSFAVFVDRAPQPPGRSVAWLFRNDDGCIPQLTGDDVRERHEATVILLDEDGERSGESAFSVEFEIEREPR